jgi:hypothetical protein
METKVETKQERKEVMSLIIWGLVAFVCLFLSLKVLKQCCAYASLAMNVSESHITIITTAFSLLFMGYLHFRGIFAFRSITDDAERIQEHLKNLLKSQDLDGKAKSSISFFSSVFKGNICVIALYYVITLMSNWIPFGLSEGFYTSTGSIILTMTALLIGGYWRCLRKKVFPQREYTMKGRDTRGKFTLCRYLVIEIIMRLLCIVIMLYPIAYKLIPYYPVAWIPIVIILIVFWCWYLILKDKV